MTSCSQLVGQAGRFEIHKITCPAGKPIKLGLVLRSSEWFSKDVREAFKGAVTSTCATIRHIKPGSLADQAGVFVHDILCTYVGQGPVGGFSHDLLLHSPASDSGSEWALLSSSEFEQLMGRAEYQPSLSFYVARKKDVPSSLTSSSSTGHTKKGVTLSWEISRRCQMYATLSPQERWELLRDAKADAQMNFETERDAVLRALPEAVTDMFWQIGFVPWGRSQQRSKTHHLPVLILCPYGVGPGKARDAWMQKFQARKEKSTLDKMNYLVYWFGEATSSEGCFSVIAQDAFIPWKQAKMQNLHRLPKTNKASTTTHQKKLQALQQILKASTQTPSERRLLLPAIPEYYESLCADDLAAQQHESSSGGIMSFAAAAPSSTAMAASSSSGRSSSSSSSSRELPAKRRRLLSFSKSAGDNQPLQALPDKPPPPRSLRLRMRSASSNSAFTEGTASVAASTVHMEYPTTTTTTRKKSSADRPKIAPVQVSPPSLLDTTDTKSVASMPTAPREEGRPNQIAVTRQVSDNDNGEAKEVAGATNNGELFNSNNHQRSVQSVLDTFCNRIQDLSRQNAVLKMQHQHLQAQVKTWREQYSALGGVVAASTSDNNKKTEDCTQQGTDDDDDNNLLDGLQQQQQQQEDDNNNHNYLNNMHVLLGKIAQQNAFLKEQNAVLEQEGNKWQAKVTSLVKDVAGKLWTLEDHGA